VSLQQRLTPARPRPGQITSKDVRKLVNAAVDAGWLFRLTGSNHGQLRSPDGRVVIHFPGSGSSQRGVKHLRADLRRNGLAL
jgi:hypothetical protein